MLAIVVGLATVLSATSVVPPPVAAKDPVAAGDPSAPGAHGRLNSQGYDPAHVAPADPVAKMHVLGTGAGAAGSQGDPSIALRTPGAPSSRPGSRIELAGKRNEHTRTFANPDGTFSTDVSSGRLNFQDANAAWQPMDLSLVSDKVQSFNLRVAANDRTVRFSDANAETSLAQIAMGDRTVSLRAIGYGAANPRNGENQVTFPVAGNQGQLAVQPTDTGFEFNVTIDRSDRATVYNFVLDTGDLTAQVGADGGTVVLVDARSVTVGQVSAPLMLEGNTPAPAGTVSLQLIARGTSTLPIDVPSAVVAGLGLHEVLLTYRIDPLWLSDPLRSFPVLLDPSICISNGNTGCINSNQTFDTSINSSTPTVNQGFTVLKTGYDARTDDGGSFAIERGLMYFSDQPLAEGAQVTNATVKLIAYGAWGSPAGKTIQMFPINRSWSTAETWNQMTSPSNGWDGSPSSSLTVPTGIIQGTAMTWDVTAITRQWYTRRGQDWKPDIGFLVKFSSEPSNAGEVDFRGSGSVSIPDRPIYTITYVVPQVDINFAPELGNTYAPSTMVQGQAVKLPLVITNDGSAFTFNSAGSDRYRIGYRWFDAKGATIACPATCVYDLTASITTATPLSQIITVTPPSSAGQYTLRLDLVHLVGSDTLYASDWASPSKYYSRNKKILTSDNTRWTGSSVVERDEFPINVISGAGTASGELRSTTLGDGSSLGINLDSRNLHYQGDTGLGFRDLLPVGLTYGYDRANAADCSGVLRACGWYTNYDERFIAGSSTGDFTYQHPSGNRYLVDTDADGQLTSTAPVLLSRPRVTYFDENNSTNPLAYAVLASSEGIPAYSGGIVVRQASNTSVGYGTVPVVELNNYRYVSFAARTTTATGVGIDFKFHNVSDPITYPDRWFIYTLGTDFSTPGFVKFPLGGAVAGIWKPISQRDLYADAVSNGAGLSGQRLQIIAFQTTTNGQSGSTYVDAVRFEPAESLLLPADANMSNWSVGQSLTGSSSDTPDGSSASVKITSAAYASSPECNTTLPSGNVCFSTSAGNVWVYPFVHWQWKKVGGSSVAISFTLKDLRDASKTGTITYYAGPTPPPGAPNPIQVDPTLPTQWALVTRNILEDSRQVLNFFNDFPTGTAPTAPPSVGPIPDNPQITAFRLVGADGNFALFDTFAYGQLPDKAAAEYGHPASQVDTTFTWDFAATYPDGSVHTFNRDGLLERISDLDGNHVDLDWTYTLSGNGPSAYTLSTVHAATDGDISGSNTYQREIQVSAATITGFTQRTFTEQLGTLGTPVTGRHADFHVATGTSGSGNLIYTVNDLVKISPARHNAGTCGPTRPDGCAEFSYTSANSHSLATVIDPRWDGTIGGAADFRFSVSYSGIDPVAVTDISHGSASQLYVSSFDAGAATDKFQRPLVQDASQRAANKASYLDLSPDGGVTTTYIPKTCTTNPCTYGTSGSYPAAPAVTDRLTTISFDGLGRVNQQTSYRVSGSAPQLSVTRQGTNAGVKVDNYADPLSAGEVLWTQDADQYFASLADSGGSNPDLYHTEYAYNSAHRVASTVSPRYDRTPDYRDAVTSTYFLRAYWRLGEASGNAADSSGNGYTATISASGVTRGAPGALARDANAAMTFNGSTGYAKVTGAAMGTVTTSFSVETWAKPATTAALMSVFGSRAPSNYGTDLKFMGDGQNLRLDLGTGSAWLVNSNIPFPYAANRWYFLELTASTGVWSVYVDGKPVGSGSYAGTPLLTDATHDLYIAQDGIAAAPEWFSGGLDDVAVYTTALDQTRVVAHYQAGRGVALANQQTTYDRNQHPTEASDNFAANGGFESGLTGYQYGQGAATVVSPDPNIQTGFGALKIPTIAYVNQDAQFVPGQTFRFQFAAKTDGIAGTHATYSLYYWQISSSNWVTLVSTYLTSGSYSTLAYDVNVPTDSDGRVRFSFWNDAHSGSGYFDDTLLVSNWGTSTYSTRGLLTDSYVLKAGTGNGATVRTNMAYPASATHPAIYPETVIANYVDGVYSSSAPDTDVPTAKVFDAWGRVTSTTDADGITNTSTYAANLTDLASTADGLGNVTTYTYDQVANQLSVVQPAGETTTTTHDLLDHPLVTTAPDGAVIQDSYDNYGQLASTIANYIDGSASGSAGADDVKTSYASDEFGQLISTIVDDGTFSGAIKAKTTATYDLLGNPVTSTAYADTAYTQPRTTTNYFETTTVSGTLYSRATSTGSRLPIAPSGTPAPLCPGTGSTYCNSRTALDMNGRAGSATDNYGKVTLTDRDLAGNVVQSIANYVDGIYDPAATDTDVITLTAYDVLGRAATVTDPAGRKTITTYDALGRPTQLTYDDTSGTPVSKRETMYTGAGRVDRASDLGDYGAADLALTWSKTEYDPAGRAIRTLQHFDSSGTPTSFHQRLDSFEASRTAWSSSASGFFTSAAASTMSLDSDFASIGPKSGQGRLRVDTNSGSGGSGAWIDLSGQTFQAGRTYHLHADLLAASANSLTASLGVDQSGGSNAQAAVSTTGAWQSVDLDWTPSAAVSANVHVAIAKASAGTLSVYLDNVAIYDTSQPDWNIPTETAYDADGRVVASVLPPGSAGGPSLVTTTAYDPTGRPVAVSINAADTYSHQIMSDGLTNGLVGYWPLDERSGSSAADQKGANSVTFGGGARLGVSGAVDEARTAVDFDGSSGYASQSANATAATDNFSLEAWFRLDTAGTNQVVAYNGIDGAGWGVGLDASGKLSGVYDGSTWLSTAVTPTVGIWHQVALIRNAGTTTLYYDGTAATPSNATAAPSAPGAGFSIGRQSSTTPRWWNGALDEVAVYTSPLAASAVSAHYAAGRESAAGVRLTSRTAYDALGRQTDQTSPRGVRTVFASDRLGNTTTTTDNYINGVTSSGAGDDDVKSTFAYDALGELIGSCSGNAVFFSACNPASGSDATAWHTTYDAMGHQSGQVPPVNTSAVALDSTSWTYDPGGRLATTCDYAAGGSCSVSTDRHTDYTYDGLGRTLTEKVYASSGTGALRLSNTLTYTVDGTPASNAFDGTGSSPSEGTNTLTFTYDPMGRPDQVKDGATVLSDSNWNTDDTLGSRVDGTTGALGTATFGYDWAKRVISISNSTLVTGTLTESWRLDGLVAGRIWPNGESATFAYDPAKRPSGATYTSAGSFSQAYDRDGNVTSEGRSLTGVSGNAGTGSQSFTYDGLNRLTASLLGTAAYAYVYDLDGNRMARGEPSVSVGYSYDATDQLVSQSISGGANTNFVYDHFGNMTGAAATNASLTSYAYDLGDRLTGITPASGSAATFSFDALGRFATRVVGTNTDTYGYLGTTEAVAGINTGGVMTGSLLDPSGARLLNKNTTTGASAFTLPDLHGSMAAAELTSSTTIADAFRYDGYGQTIASGGAGSGPAEPYRYQGRLDVSPDTNEPLYDMSARFYQASLGVFTQLDGQAGSAQDPLSMNRFLYAEANPTTLVDPGGHAALSGLDFRNSDRVYYTTAPSSKSKTASAPPRRIAHTIGRPIAPRPVARHLLETADAAKKVRTTHTVAFAFAPKALTASDAAHTALDAAGFGPGPIGIGADLSNAALYAGQGDWGNAALSVVTAIPLFGDAVGLVRGGRRAVETGRAAEEAVAEAIDIERAAGKIRVPGTGPGGYRLPDFDPHLTIPTRGAVVEVKQVVRLSWSSQISDLLAVAKESGVVLEMWTNAPIPSRGLLAEAIQRGDVILHALP